MLEIQQKVFGSIFFKNSKGEKQAFFHFWADFFKCDVSCLTIGSD